MEERVNTLQEKVANLEADSNVAQANLLAKLKVETSSYILQRLTDWPTAVTPDPGQLAEIYNLYRRIMELTPELVPESNRLAQNGMLKNDGTALRALMEGTGITPMPANPAPEPQETSV